MRPVRILNANAQTDLNPRWAHMSEGTFSGVAALIIPKEGNEGPDQPALILAFVDPILHKGPSLALRIIQTGDNSFSFTVILNMLQAVYMICKPVSDTGCEKTTKDR